MKGFKNSARLIECMPSEKKEKGSLAKDFVKNKEDRSVIAHGEDEGDKKSSKPDQNFFRKIKKQTKKSCRQDYQTWING